MPDALVGHTGFVGGNLAAQHLIEHGFNSKNIESIAGQSFDTLVVSGMPAAMWKANSDPAGDRAVLDRLSGCVRQCRASQVVVISTIAVYPPGGAVDEDTVPDAASLPPYGRHRLMLEQQLTEHFARVLVVRLPGLFGPGLKKNAVYDLLHDNQTEKIHAGAVFQFYNLTHLWRHIEIARNARLSLVNIATEPITVQEVAREAFGLDFTNEPGPPPPRYDMRTKHAGLFGGHGGYLFGRDRVLSELKAFVDAERAKAGASV